MGKKLLQIKSKKRALLNFTTRTALADILGHAVASALPLKAPLAAEATYTFLVHQ